MWSLPVLPLCFLLFCLNNTCSLKEIPGIKTSIMFSIEHQGPLAMNKLACLGVGGFVWHLKCGSPGSILAPKLMGVSHFEVTLLLHSKDCVFYAPVPTFSSALPPPRQSVLTQLPPSWAVTACPVVNNGFKELAQSLNVCSGRRFWLCYRFSFPVLGQLWCFYLPAFMSPCPWEARRGFPLFW